MEKRFIMSKKKLDDLAQEILARCPKELKIKVEWPDSDGVYLLDLKRFTTEFLQLGREEYRITESRRVVCSEALFRDQSIRIYQDPGYLQYYVATRQCIIVPPEEDVRAGGPAWQREARYAEMKADSLYIIFDYLFAELKAHSESGKLKNVPCDTLAARLAPRILAPDEVLDELMRCRDFKPFIWDGKIVPLQEFAIIRNMAYKLQIPVDILTGRLKETGYLRVEKPHQR